MCLTTAISSCFMKSMIIKKCTIWLAKSIYSSGIKSLSYFLAGEAWEVAGSFSMVILTKVKKTVFYQQCLTEMQAHDLSPRL